MAEEFKTLQHTGCPPRIVEVRRCWAQGSGLRLAHELRQGVFNFLDDRSPGIQRSLQKEVVPVDTHVYQIAVKHYGLRGTGGKKATMTPKLYEEVNAKFFSIWGEYAGWAHTVRWLFFGQGNSI